MRQVLYVCFGVVGVAGVGIGASNGELGNVAVNGLVTAAGVGIFLFDQKVRTALPEESAEPGGTVRGSVALAKARLLADLGKGSPSESAEPAG